MILIEWLIETSKATPPISNKADVITLLVMKISYCAPISHGAGIQENLQAVVTEE
jgi:hypothetical protein